MIFFDFDDFCSTVDFKLSFIKVILTESNLWLDFPFILRGMKKKHENNFNFRNLIV